MFKRLLNLAQIKPSFFLFGPRQVGKTFLIQHTLKPDLYVNLLSSHEHKRYSRDPSLLSREAGEIKNEPGLLVIDEIQRCPELLNEVQIILGNKPQTQCILTGSSARKLKRAGVNLLGGRAITVHLHPLTSQEMGGEYPLIDILQFGSLPNVVLEKEEINKARLLKAYAETYLKEEVQQEALTRNIPAFSKFLELAAFENGNVINYQNLARETGVHSKTIKEYFQILEDTLLGYLLFPYGKSHRRRVISHPKFYFFDCGIVTALRGDLSQEIAAGTPPFGRKFEHLIILETKRLLDYREREAKISFFRTSDGAEVDLILELCNEIWAVEIKSSSAPALSEVRGLRGFIKDHKYNRALCVCQTPHPFKNEGVEFMPWQDFLAQL